MNDLDLDMNDEWVQIYAKLPHYEKRGGKWVYVHNGGEILSEVSKDKAKELDREQKIWKREAKRLEKEWGQIKKDLTN